MWMSQKFLKSLRFDKQQSLKNSTILRFVDRASRYMHYLSSVYSVTIPLQVSGLLVAHICNKWYVLYVLVDCRLAWLRWDHVGSHWKNFHENLYLSIFLKSVEKT
jgi:hypothetical protein